MNPKASAILEKAGEERRRSNFKKAIERLEEGVEKFPGEFSLYTEAIDVGMEAGESLRAIQIFKKAHHKFSDRAFEVWTFAAEKVGAYNDSIMGRFLVEQAVKTGDLAAAASILDNLKDHAVSDLLERIRIKKQTTSVARGPGSSGRGEIASFTVTEALLSLRLGRMQAAMDGFVTAIAEDPALAGRIEPFLADFESRGEAKGETAFALGCCFVERRDFAQGIAKLSQAARTAAELVPRVIEKIESFGESPELPLDLRDLTLAQLYLGLGDKKRASGLLKNAIERTPGRAADAVDLLRSSVETVGDDLETQFVFVEAAFTAGRRETALGQLRKIHKDKRHATRLVEWLESRNKNLNGSTEVQLFFAETALNEGLFGKAIEIFKEILSRGPQEQPIIRELLSRHESVPVVRAFYKERFAASRDEEKAKTGAFELERYDTQSFRPRDRASAAAEEPAAGEPEDGPRSAGSEPFQTTESVFRRQAAEQRARRETPPSDFDNHDFSLSMHEPAVPAGDVPAPAEHTAESFTVADPPVEQPETGTQPETAARPGTAEPAPDDSEGSDFFEYLRRHSSSDGTEAAGASPPASEPDTHAVFDEPPAVAAGPEDAAPQDETASEPATAPGETEAAGDEELAESESAPESESLPEEEEYRDFDALYRAALDGRLDHARMIEAAGRALDEGRIEETKRLLSFDPANLGEDIARKFHLARYYLEKDQPLPALVALKTVHLNSLSREERKDFMLRIAECYRVLHNFDAAHGVYLRIMTENPGLSDVEALARANYARYVETETGSAAALEKTTNL